MPRRTLRTYKLNPPDYIINPQVLMESYLEKEIGFCGIISNVPPHIDSTNRTGILKLMDIGKQQGTIQDCVADCDDAIFILSAFKIKIARRDGEEFLIQSAIHEVAAICYICENEYHYLVLKVGESGVGGGSSTKCQLVILQCSEKSQAEELCALISQCFQLVYVEAIMYFFDAQLRDGAQLQPPSEHSVSTRNEDLGNKPSFLTGSQQSLGAADQTSPSSVRGQRKTSMTCSESEVSGSATELIHDYFWTLHTKLNAGELKQFALLLSRWHSDLPFSEFCQKVAELFGPDRKFLLRGMRPFIPEKDYDTFESFLVQSGITADNTSVGSGQGEHTPRLIRRGASVGSQTGGLLVDEHDQMLASISSQISRLAQDDSSPT